MAGRGAKKAPKKKGANGYKLPDPIPSGEILTDLTKKQWIIGSSIGVGGFGEIYAAAPYAGKAPKDHPAVIKIEPHGNGPLFVEMHFYMRNAKTDDIEAWRKKKKLSFLGMPRFLGSGSHELHSTRYRFVVMERYSTDLWKLFLENHRVFPEHAVYQVALQIIDVLEYIHSRTYVHADIKGGNLLLSRDNPNQVYLVDFGLASHYSTKPEYKLDPKKAHNGTIEYTSRDAHMGVPTMRGDMEILTYNIIQWLCDSLPWEKNLTDPSAVQKQKESAFSDTKKFLNQCFSTSVPAAVTQFTSLLSEMKFNDTPDYEKFKNILIKGLKDLGKTPGGKLEFVGKATAAPKAAAATKVSKASNEKRTPAKTKRTPKKVVKDEEEVIIEKRKVPSLKLKRLSSEANSMNDSMVVMNNTCISGDDVMTKVLSTIDPGADYEVHIKKKKRVAEKKTETPDKKPTRGIGTYTKRIGKVEKKKSRKQSESDSEPEVYVKIVKGPYLNYATAQGGWEVELFRYDLLLNGGVFFIHVIKTGTRSRPRAKTTPKKKKNLSLDSETDMFDDC